MMFGSMITYYRKKMGITQEQLAQKLEVTNQAVSKWETDQCCPDTMLLPKLADVFEITIDQLFGRKGPETAAELPWEDDGALHIVVYAGHELVGAARSDSRDLTFHYEGPARDIYCAIGLSCGDVEGNVKADGYVECGDVGGGVAAGGYVECGDVSGDLDSASYVECGDVGGSIDAMSYVECGDVGGSVNAMSYVECGDVGGSVKGDGDGSGFHFGPFGRK